MTELRASEYTEPFSIVSSLVKPIRMALDDKTAINPGPQESLVAIRIRSGESLYNKIRDLPHCFAAARTTKHLNFLGDADRICL